jgi:ABC-type nitrate/sulfonate/bicarbonate transport system substrate-binding protein
VRDDIKSFADLKGKKIAGGPAASGSEANTRQIFEANGMSYKDLGQALFLSNAEAASAIKDRQIDNYQLVVPSTWNASPRDAKGNRSAYEESLIGTPVAKDDQPLEIIRTIHSFDPCLACAVHVYDPDGKMVHQVSVN